MNHRESFLVRVWFDSTCLPSQMRGEVQHVRSGQSRRFCGQEELLSILNEWIDAIRDRAADTESFAVVESEIGDSP